MRKPTVLVAALFVCVVATAAGAAEYVIKPGSPNQVIFTSKAATETFQGKTDQMTGSFSVDPAAVGDSLTVNVAVDLASLDTGIKKRNQHMAENHLETKKYPKAVFKGATLRSGNGTALVVGTPATFEVEGAFTLHGVTRRLRTTVEVLLKDASTIEFKTAFPVPLADYKINRPKFLFLKLGEVQEITVTGTAKLAS